MSESSETLRIGESYGGTALWRPPWLGASTTPDIAWVRYALGRLQMRPDSFAILRPTSPFRRSATIDCAYQQFLEMGDCGDSLRAVELLTDKTPYKYWLWAGPGHPIKPLLDGVNADGVPYHSCPTQSCPGVYVQNSSLEMAWTSCVEVHGTISGRKIRPFFTEGVEGFAIDTMADWDRAINLAEDHPEWLPIIKTTP